MSKDQRNPYFGLVALLVAILMMVNGLTIILFFLYQNNLAVSQQLQHEAIMQATYKSAIAEGIAVFCEVVIGSIGILWICARFSRKNG